MRKKLVLAGWLGAFTLSSSMLGMSFPAGAQNNPVIIERPSGRVDGSSRILGQASTFTSSVAISDVKPDGRFHDDISLTYIGDGYIVHSTSVISIDAVKIKNSDPDMTAFLSRMDNGVGETLGDAETDPQGIGKRVSLLNTLQFGQLDPDENSNEWDTTRTRNFRYEGELRPACTCGVAKEGGGFVPDPLSPGRYIIWPHIITSRYGTNDPLEDFTATGSLPVIRVINPTDTEAVNRQPSEKRTAEEVPSSEESVQRHSADVYSDWANALFVLSLVLGVLALLLAASCAGTMIGAAAAGTSVLAISLSLLEAQAGSD